jgi:NAD+ kinase
MFRTVHIVAKLNSEQDPKVRRVVEAVCQVAVKEGARMVDLDQVLPDTLIVAIGGDGTMLQALRLAAQFDATAIGINMGKVGFLTDFEHGNDQDHLAQIKKQIASVINDTEPTMIDRRIVLWSSASDMFAGNEVSVSRAQSDSMISYKLLVGHAFAGVHKANSILISTATGSTAYSLSAGGALIMPNLSVIQIVPVAPLTMTSRPIITDARDTIRLSVWGGTIAVRHDGQTVSRGRRVYTEEKPYEIQIRPHITTAKILHLASWNFFDVLSQKLGWIKK